MNFFFFRKRESERERNHSCLFFLLLFSLQIEQLDQCLLFFPESSSMSARRPSALMLVRPFRVRLSILDLRTSQSANTNETSTSPSKSQGRLNLTSLKKYSHIKSELVTIADRDQHDREIIQSFLNATNEIEARKILSQMWKESRFCDLMLVVDGSEYLAHRIVLGREQAFISLPSAFLSLPPPAFSGIQLEISVERRSKATRRDCRVCS